MIVMHLSGAYDARHNHRHRTYTGNGKWASAESLGQDFAVIAAVPGSSDSVWVVQPCELE